MGRWGEGWGGGVKDGEVGLKEGEVGVKEGRWG